MNRFTQKGFVALFSVLVIGALVLLVSIGASLRGVEETQTSIGNEASKKARALANLCAEQALFNLLSDRSYHTVGDPVAHWTFNVSDVDLSTSTAEIIDRSGNGNKGDWEEHASTTISGKIGQALEFDGSDDLVRISGPDAVTISSGRVTVAAWIYPTAPGQSSASRVAAKHSDNDGDDDTRIDWGIVFNSDSTVEFRVSSNAGAENTGISSISTLPLNQWSHVVGLYDNSQVQVYINGIEDNSGAVSLTLQGRSDSDVGIGSHPGPIAAANRRFEGIIDDVRIYDRALSEEEIGRLIPEEITVDGEMCAIFPVGGIGNTNRVVQTESTVGGYTKKIQVAVDQISPVMEIASWKEVADF